MSTENKTELAHSQGDVINDEQDSPTNTSSETSAGTWNTPVSSTESGSIPSSVLWGTPKSFQVSGERAESVRGADDGENTLIQSPVMSTGSIPRYDPPPYFYDELQGLESPLMYIRDLFFDGSRMSSNRNQEMASLIENSMSPTSTPPTSIHIRNPSRILFRSFRDDSIGNMKEETSFARRYGTICIVAFFVIFLMILSLIAKFIVNSTIRL
ncbi:uncharacterized protein [Fopius arisanus]|uniref:Uncharacterized protein n=1 Tax=Fopius arisanus TaxID=64838 RepID=A0A9R1SZ33_9HYME|nr:PREDICTED: uncharacterized protein LOC105264533 [Fopius arisanus]